MIRRTPVRAGGLRLAIVSQGAAPLRCPAVTPTLRGGGVGPPPPPPPPLRGGGGVGGAAAGGWGAGGGGEGSCWVAALVASSARMWAIGVRAGAVGVQRGAKRG